MPLVGICAGGVGQPISLPRLRHVFTSGIVATAAEGREIALFFTGREHAGENIAKVMKRREAELPSAIQMCDALSRNVPKLPAGVEILLANCMAHGRRQFVEVAANFPGECRYVLETLGQVYGHDAEARELTAEERLRFLRKRSGPVMDELHGWLEAQFAERKNGAERGARQSDHVPAETLAAVDAVSAASRGPAGQ